MTPPEFSYNAHDASAPDVDATQGVGARADALWMSLLPLMQPPVSYGNKGAALKLIVAALEPAKPIEPKKTYIGGDPVNKWGNV